MTRDHGYHSGIGVPGCSGGLYLLLLSPAWLGVPWPVAAICPGFCCYHDRNLEQISSAAIR
jgi:hypothetical protein